MSDENHSYRSVTAFRVHDERRVVPFDASVDRHGCKSNTYMNSTSIDSINIERIVMRNQSCLEVKCPSEF
jgi:hypothetical protein